MHSDVTSVSAGAGLGAILPLGIGFILAVITPLIAIYTHRRKRDEWRHMNWITALYIIGSEGIATVLIYGGAKNGADVDYFVVGAFSTFFLMVGLMSVIAIAGWFMLVVSNLNSRRGDTLGG